MVNNALVFVVDKFSLPIHIGAQVAGFKYPVSVKGNQAYLTRGLFSLLADLANINQNTEVFFYQRRVDEPPTHRGFLGIWKPRQPDDGSVLAYEDTINNIAHPSGMILARCAYCRGFSSKVEDKQVVCSNCGKGLEGHILPLRLLLQPTQIYPAYVDDNTAYIDITDNGRLSTLIFRKVYGAGRERSVTPILPEEAEKIKRLLAKAQQSQLGTKTAPIPNPTIQPHLPPSPVSGVIQKFLDFTSQNYLFQGKSSTLYNPEGEVIFETVLESWFVNEIQKSSRQILGTLCISNSETLEWFGNQILFGIGGEKSDVVLLLRNEDQNRCRAVIVELKRETVNNDTFDQLERYAYWIAQLVTANIQSAVSNPFYITPIAIGHRVARDLKLPNAFSFTIPYHIPLNVQVEAPRVYTYTASRTGIYLTRKV